MWNTECKLLVTMDWIEELFLILILEYDTWNMKYGL